ncbi:unnamed protein product [Adineta ricciae]|uniref:Programmed cell death protein 10 dimerisation domain-containing protein n=1 Tax=Adineta ricciae TaxID=249248 RepID=A0A815VI38_ADIRI|nr:unnamed protein product [Adineta ricciae]
MDDKNTASSTTNALILPNVVYPVVEQMDKSGYKDLQKDLRQHFYLLEQIYPGFSHCFLQSFLRQQNPPCTFNLNELTLKLEKYCDKSSYLISNLRSEAEFQELNLRAKNLKRILSRIPDDITEKREFLETIKEIASAIKKTLDSVSNTYQYFKTSDGRQALENEKKEFIKYSKNFSNTLKAYFRDNQRDDVYIAANHLLVQTDYLLRTIKFYCETDAFDECLYPLIPHQQTSNRLTPAVRYSHNDHRPISSATNRPHSSYETNFT